MSYYYKLEIVGGVTHAPEKEFEKNVVLGSGRRPMRKMVPRLREKELDHGPGSHLVAYQRK